MLRKRLLTILILLFCFSTADFGQNTDLSLKTVVIDAGHGGKDSGTRSGNVFEKDIVLGVALKVGKFIQKDHPEVKVIYTRKTDRFIPLNERAEIANKNKADLFLSIHVNFYQSPSIAGTETYILGNPRSEENNQRLAENLKVEKMENSVILLEDDYTTRYEGFDPNSAESHIMFDNIQNAFLDQSLTLADQIQNHFIDVANRKSRGVRQAGFLVLRETIMPSILIELGYISNSNERQFLVSNKGQDQLALAIAKAFDEYKKNYDERSAIKLNESEEDEAPVNTTSTAEELPFRDQVLKGKWYAVQIMASKKELTNSQLKINDDEFLFHIEENGWNKYYLGFTQNYTSAIELQKEIGKKHKGAFLVVFNKGKKEKFAKF